MTQEDDIPIYISIYDRPKRGKGRPKCDKTDEEQKEIKRTIALKHYYDNYEYKHFQNTLYREKNKNTSTI